MSPYDCEDGSFQHPPSTGAMMKGKKRSKSVSAAVSQTSEGNLKKKLFGRKKSLPTVPYSISNPNFLDTAGSSDETDEERGEKRTRGPSVASGKPKSGASSRRASEQVLTLYARTCILCSLYEMYHKEVPPSDSLLL